MSVQTIYTSEEGKRRILNYYEAYLPLIKVEFERVYVDTRFGITHTLVAGPVEGKPLFIFQGGNCINPMTLSWFSSLFEEYRIYAPDTIGNPGYSAETRVSAKDDSYALWVADLMNHFGIEKSACIGPSYGAGIILRTAAYMPEKIACSVLMAPSGLQMGSKLKMVQKILLPLIRFQLFSDKRGLQKIADAMSLNSMKEIDRQIIEDIFTHVDLSHEMPKRTEKKELAQYTSPTMVLAGTEDIFFPGDQVVARAEAIIPNLVAATTYPMGHFPSDAYLQKMNDDIKQFLSEHYSFSCGD
ncbi:alpha/beta hydrolase [Brevibacillus humidisoli]|uniref:alpha/beta fold hydrolase n=1 Tax=Brevibacillus humidisoli TaxID=2895522 RepID=UPI001E2BB93C|nr:alpha/beta hydrolase [Brevibacillus humidisoli]UFJ42326.1 alpha/beta hydrolase [Brevibacillus humidisoli]